MVDLIVVREANSQDCSAVKMLIDALENTSLDTLIFSAIFQEYVEQTNTIMFVIEHASDGVIAFASCKGQNLLHHLGLVFEIQELIVHAKHRNKGYGRLLISKIQEVVIVRGAKSLEVTSNKRRKDAHKFYAAVGFRNSHEKFTIYF